MNNQEFKDPTNRSNNLASERPIRTGKRYSSPSLREAFDRETLESNPWGQFLLFVENSHKQFTQYHPFGDGDIFANLDTTRPPNILVYDLGGGTLDISLHAVEWNSDISQFIIGDIAISSRTRIGRDMVDEKIVDYLFEKYSKIKKLSVPEQKKLWYELRVYAEKFKQLWGAEYTSSKEGEDFKLAFETLDLNATFPIFYSFSYRHMQEALKELLCPDICPELLNRLDPTTTFD